MARIISGMGCSHVPAIGAAIDNKKTETPHFKKLFEGYQPARDYMQKNKPDVAIVVYNDHASAFSLELVPTFVLGVADQYSPADEGYGPRPLPIAEGHPDLAWHMAQSLILNEFDMTLANVLEIDHGCTVPMNVAFGNNITAWPSKIIPICVNVIKYPPPTGLRCYKLGQAIRQAVESFEEDITVSIFGTGGMSHQLQGERAGLINSEFDTMFLDQLTQDPKNSAKRPHVEYIRDAGSEGVELVMWFIMRGALSDNCKEVYRYYHVPVSNTAAGLIILDDQ